MTSTTSRYVAGVDAVRYRAWGRSRTWSSTACRATCSARSGSATSCGAGLGLLVDASARRRQAAGHAAALLRRRGPLFAEMRDVVVAREQDRELAGRASSTDCAIGSASWSSSSGGGGRRDAPPRARGVGVLEADAAAARGQGPGTAGVLLNHADRARLPQPRSVRRRRYRRVRRHYRARARGSSAM